MYYNATTIELSQRRHVLAWLPTGNNIDLPDPRPSEETKISVGGEEAQNELCIISPIHTSRIQNKTSLLDSVAHVLLKRPKSVLVAKKLKTNSASYRQYTHLEYKIKCNLDEEVFSQSHQTPLKVVDIVILTTRLHLKLRVEYNFDGDLANPSDRRGFEYSGSTTLTRPHTLLYNVAAVTK
ncbi:hypothetical protein J6590_068146 [Homalodisca vitripennis]|nr:hypothetical protein J6590_068146 [Homalodisca vitripennis]